MTTWNLQPASFKGVPFMVQDPTDRSHRVGVESTRERLRKRVQVYQFPFVDGAVVEDLGRAPLLMQLRAIWWGPGYYKQWRRFNRLALDTVGPGELVHPIHGSIRAQFVEAELDSSHGRRNAIVAELSFLEARRQANAFQGDEVANLAAAIQGADDASSDQALRGKDAIAVIARAVGLNQIADLADEYDATTVFRDLLDIVGAVGADLEGQRITSQVLATLERAAIAEEAREEYIANRQTTGTP